MKKMKPATFATTSLSLAAAFLLSNAEMPAQVRPGGGRVHKTDKKTPETTRPAKSSDKNIIHHTAPSEDFAPHSEPANQQAGTIEIWVDNQSLHASDRNIGSPESPLRSITAALRKAVREVGDAEVLIRVLPGIYRESLEVPDYDGSGRIIIRGENAERTIISGGELLAYWQPRTNPQGGPVLYAHEDVFPDGEKTGAFYAGSVRQKKSAAQSPGPGEFVLKNGEILWMPPAGLDWRHTEITAPVRPYPVEDTSQALVAISGGRVRLESLTLRHCAQAHAVVAVTGAAQAAFHNLRLTDNEAPGLLVIGNASSPGKCRILADKIKTFGTKTPFFSVRDADFTLHDSLLEEGAKTSEKDAPHKASSPLIKTGGRGLVHISQCLIACRNKDAWLDFASREKTTLQRNTFLQAAGLTRVAFSGGEFSLVGNYFLSGSDDTKGITLFEVRTPARDSAATWQGNVFQSHLVVLLAEGTTDYRRSRADAREPYARWTSTGNCVVPGAALRVMQSNQSIFRTGLSQPLVSLTNELGATEKCDEGLVAQAASNAREKLRLLRD